MKLLESAQKINRLYEDPYTVDELIELVDDENTLFIDITGHEQELQELQAVQMLCYGELMKEINNYRREV